MSVRESPIDDGEEHDPLFALALELAGVGVLTTDARGAVCFMNETARRLLDIGRDADDGAEILLTDFHEAAEVAGVASAWAAAGRPCATAFDAVVAGADDGARREWTWVSRAGARVRVALTARALRGDDGTWVGWLIVALDSSPLRAARDAHQRVAALQSELDALRRREAERGKIAEAYEYLSASRSLREALRVIAAFLPSIFGGEPPLLLVRRAVDRGDADGDIDGERGGERGGEGERSGERRDRLPAIEPGDCWSLKTGLRFVSAPGGLRCRHLDDDGRAWVCAPLADGAETVAILTAPLPASPQTTTAAMPSPADPSDLARQLSSALAHLRLRRTLEEQATHDPLTGAVNRRQLDGELRRSLHRLARHGQPFAVLLLDVDHFKHINDAFGHERGDRVLAGLGTLLRRRLRASDALARLGGEEFVVVVRGVDAAATETLAEMLRAAVEAARLAGPEVPCTVSIGVTHVAATDGDAGAPDAIDVLLRRADRALYAAKGGGRNRVAFANEPSPPGAPTHTPPSTQAPPSPQAPRTAP